MAFTDNQLATLVTPLVEANAAEYVDSLGVFPTTPVDWRQRLINLRAYIVVSQEHISAPDDVFSIKIKEYRQEWGVTLAQAKEAAQSAGEIVAPLFSVPIGRG